MTGCPSREQLANLVADRTIEVNGFDVDDHVRSCPECRAVLEALSLGCTIDSGLRSPVSVAIFAPASGVSADEPNAPADCGQTVDTFSSEPRPANSVAVEPHSSAVSSASEAIDTGFRGPTGSSSSVTLDSSLDAPSASSFTETIDGSSWDPAGFSSSETVAAPSGEAFPRASGASTAARGASSASSSSGETQEATLEALLATSEATLDFSQVGPSGPRKTIPGSSFAPGKAGKKGPADYEILGELGRGGMGIVYKALHLRLNRLVALKMIRGGAHADDIQIVRFRIEAEAVAALRHPNILQIYDIGESDGLPYVALELLEGGSLAERLRGTPLPPRKAAEWMVPMALAMDAAHRAGIVHRDLKSVNILFTTDDVPKVTDFGLAKRLELDEGQTHTGQVMGTPSYMAPEQARGDTKTVGPPADIYALGAILYEMLTGRPPFKGVSAMDTVKQVLEVEPVAPSRVQYRVPRDLETICLKCLQKEPRKRYATAKDLADDLNRYLAGEPIKARRTPPVERGVKWVKRHPTHATLLAFAILAVFSLCGTGAWYWRQARAAELDAANQKSELLNETNKALLGARALISKNQLKEAKFLLSTRQYKLSTATVMGIEDVRAQINTMLEEVDNALEAESKRVAQQKANDEVQSRYDHFVDRRKETLFRDTQFTGLMLPANLDLTRKAAEEALGVFGKAGENGDWTLGALPASLSSEQQTDVNEGCYEMLLVLAEATANQSPGQADRALRVLECADRLRPGRSRAYHLNKAACLAKKGDQAGKVNELADAQRLRPETAFDYFLSGQQEYKDKRYADAIRDFDSALRLKPTHFWAKCLQAICDIQTVQYDAAVSSLTDCIQTDPNFAWLYLLRGFASGQRGVRYLNLVKSSPGRETDVKMSAEHEFHEAEADFQRALDRLQSSPDADLQYVLLINRGLVRFQRGRFDQAAADYRDAIQLKKDPYLAHAELAHVYEKRDKPDLAIEQFTRAIALKPDWSPLYRGRAKVLQISGTHDASRRSAALADLKLAIDHEQRDNPVLAQDHTNRGLLLYQDERFEDALEESRIALNQVPNFVDAHVLQVRSLLQLRRYDDVIRSCDSAIAMGKKFAVLYDVRGLANEARHDYPAAIRDFGQALEIRPHDAELLAKRGWAYLTFDSPRLALADFQEAIKVAPADSDAYNGRGTAHALRGDHAAAVADAREALRHNGTSPRVIYNAARIYALAAAAAARAVGEKGRQARQLAARYEDVAVQLIRQRFEVEAPEKRAAFWQDTVRTDPALKAIRRRIKFEDLIVTKK